MKQTKMFKSIMVVCLLFLSGGCKGGKIFDNTPSERSQTFIDNLREELVSAPSGWRVIYFPNTDSLIFNNHSQTYQEREFLYNSQGYGGRYFHMKFHQNGTVEMLSDATKQSATTPRTSKFQITQGAAAQLSFVTHNYIHDLVNSGYKGCSDFYFLRRENNRDILMTTLSYTNVEREYILFQKIPDAEAWVNDMQNAYDNRVYFEDRHNFQIKIHQGDRIYFISDRDFRDKKVKGDLLKPFRDESLRKQYHLFIYTAIKGAYEGDKRERFSVLGSGYTGTFDGLTFRSGIRYGTKYTFRDFKRDGNGFVSELVRVYDPIYRTWRLESKHRFPNGEPTGMVAHIYPLN